MKARNATEAKKLEDIPNIGKRVAEDLRRIGITEPKQLAKKNPMRLYDAICKDAGAPVDPCMIDVMMAAVDFMNGAPAAPWWAYTPKRKKLLAP